MSAQISGKTADVSRFASQIRGAHSYAQSDRDDPGFPWRVEIYRYSKPQFCTTLYGNNPSVAAQCTRITGGNSAASTTIGRDAPKLCRRAAGSVIRSRP